MAAVKPKTFRALLEPTGDALRWVIARVPFDPAEVWPVRRGRRVRGEINGFAFRTSLFPEAGGKKHVLLVNKKMQAGAGAKAGETVQIRLEPDLEEREAAIPAELVKALKADRSLRRYFDAMSPSMRRDVGRWVGEPKSSREPHQARRAGGRVASAGHGRRAGNPADSAGCVPAPAGRAGGLGGHDARPPAQSLLSIFHYQTAEAREKRTRMAVEDALKVIKRLNSTGKTERPE